MLMVISPAKTLDFETPVPDSQTSQATHLTDSQQLIDGLKKLTPADLAKLMSISDALAHLNVGRFHDWKLPFDRHNARQAVLAFMGDVYEGLDAYTLKPEQFDWLQSHLGILSGLYGYLRPLDLIQPYRLEMGTKFATGRGKDLYAFWGERITQTLNQALANKPVPILVNLASNEYFKSVMPKKLQARIITPVFQDLKGSQYKVVSFHAKRARGLMVRWAVEHKVEQAEALKAFDSEGYGFDPAVSDENKWIFRRTS